jgi:hypothetical protein
MQSPEIVPSLVVPKYPLILTRINDEQIAAVVPHLRCTKVAIRDLFKGAPDFPGYYRIFNSKSKIIDLANKAVNHQHPVLHYTLFMKAEDYIAMAGIGLLGNEYGRITILE